MADLVPLRDLTQRIEHMNIPGRFRHPLGSVLRNKPAVLIEHSDLWIHIVRIDAVGPFILIVEPHGTIVGTTNLVPMWMAPELYWTLNKPYI